MVCVVCEPLVWLSAGSGSSGSTYRLAVIAKPYLAAKPQPGTWGMPLLIG